MAAYAVIMAGGSGTRFWPMSRGAKPKQLLPLTGKESLLRTTVRRLGPLIPLERTIVVTSKQLADDVRAELPGIPAANVLAEPCGRNTAPCVGWAATHIRASDPGAVLAVVPADHHIGDEDAFRDVLARAISAAEEGDLVTVGVRPTRPETGYGYIELGEELAPGVHRARRFVEKPNRQRASQFVTSGNFLWNSGMFFFKAQNILDEMDRHLPGVARALKDVEQAGQDHAPDVLERIYANLPSISIDHGVMEKAAAVTVVPGDFGWSDIGSWTAAWELAAKDEHGNAAPESAVLLETRNCYARVQDGKLVALLGVDDLVVVDTDDVLLVMPRHRSQDVRDIVTQLKAQNRTRLV